MTSKTPNQAEPASIEKPHGSYPHEAIFVKPPAPLRSSVRSGGRGPRQESARGRTAGDGIRRDNAGFTICGRRLNPLAGGYFIPAIYLMAERNLLPENASNDLINHLRVTEEERRLFHTWRQSANQSPEASNHKTAECSSTISPDILSNFRTTDEERQFLQWLRGNFWSAVSVEAWDECQ